MPAPGLELLRLQDGVLSAEQAAVVGINRSAIRTHLDAGRWQRLHEGVYAVFTGPVPFRTRVWAALLRVGATATASYLTAACLDGLTEEPGEVIHVSVVSSRRVVGRPRRHPSALCGAIALHAAASSVAASYPD